MADLSAHTGSHARDLADLKKMTSGAWLVAAPRI
jgi:hypothetical protein